MTSLFIVNGKVQLVLKPENESDKFLLDKLLKQGVLVVESAKGTVMEHSVADGIVIKLKSEASES